MAAQITNKKPKPAGVKAAGAIVMVMLLSAASMILPAAAAADRSISDSPGRLLVPSTTQLRAATERGDAATSTTTGQPAGSAGSTSKKELPAALQGASVTFNVSDCSGM